MYAVPVPATYETVEEVKKICSILLCAERKEDKNIGCETTNATTMDEINYEFIIHDEALFVIVGVQMQIS